MSRRWRQRKKREAALSSLPLYRLFPNVITLLSLCAGLSAIRFAIQEQWEISVGLVVAAAFLDGIDGRLARLLNATSNFGAQLDSLADFLNFGVAPALILYQWQLHEVKGFGWAVSLFYTLCCSIRLARFNASLEDSSQKEIRELFFFGIPSPSGAGLALFPMILTFLFAEKFDSAPFVITPWMTILYTAIIALLMVSRIPTFAAKRIKVKREFVPLSLALAGLFLISLVLEPWLTLPVMGVLYLSGLPLSLIWYYVKFGRRNVAAAHAESLGSKL